MNTLHRLPTFLKTAFAGILLSVTALAGASASAQGETHTGAATTTVVADKAIFAGGCFWCVESDFDKLPGVISTTSGYTGGKTVNPSYEQVSAHTTGHAEAVEVLFDPAKVSYEKLVDFYWHSIDPTTKDAQFCDHGSPYRTVIFAVNEEQLKIAKGSRAALEKSKPFKEAIVTEIVMAGPFYPAEEYHQNYYKKNPLRYFYYRSSCGRDARVKQLWGQAVH